MKIKEGRVVFTKRELHWVLVAMWQFNDQRRLRGDRYKSGERLAKRLDKFLVGLG